TPIIADGVERQTASEERITYISGNDTLVGYLSSPQTERPYPVIVVLHSASHGHHDNDLYNHLETQMNDMGVGVFTYDRRGSGESTGDFNTASLPTLAQDALNAIEELRTRSDIDTDRIGLFGISQGGWLGPIAYSISPSDISFMILVSSSGVSPADQMEYSAVTTLKMNGHSQEVIDKAIHLRNITNAYYRGRRDRESTQEEIDRFREEEWFNDVYLPWQGNLPNDVGVTKWIHEMDLDPVEYFQHVDIPIALFYGATDRWVPIEESMDVWRTVFEKNGNTNFEFHRIDRAGHMMILDEDNEPEVEIISDQYTKALKRWVVENVFE
ncbi:MAG: alpha/beta fold hydrolase, partial [Flavobacteriales bacterium]|nr:alpha/beta fold hydrolase [Flavobacteriales bacterium]